MSYNSSTRIFLVSSESKDQETMMKILRHHSMRTRMFYLLIAIPLTGLLSCAERPTPLKTGLPTARLISEVDEAVPEMMERAMIPGLSVSLIRDGMLVWSKGFGVKNRQSLEPVDDQTVFEAASLSKPVFAYAVLKLVERSILNLDTPLIEYVDIPYLEATFLQGKLTDDRIRKITARMVLCHTPGFPNWRNRGNPIEILFEPGEKYSYSGEGFQYLQTVVEKVTGMRMNAFMQEEVFYPLKMTHSSYVWKPEFDETSAFPHNMFEEVSEKRKPTFPMAAATLHTTAPDFARFILAIMNHEGLSKSTIEEMLSSQSVVESEGSGEVTWGLGVGLETTPHGPAYWHWGDNMLFRCLFVAFPEQKLGMVYFTNSFNGLSVRKQMVAAAIGGEHPIMDSSTLDDYGDVDAPGMVFVQTIVRDGIEAALKIFEDLSEKMNPEDIMDERAMNGLGYGLMRSGKIDAAIEVFKLNVNTFPESSNVYDSLGEAYMNAGEHKLAIQNYEKSIELNPDNENGKQMLERIRKEMR